MMVTCYIRCIIALQAPLHTHAQGEAQRLLYMLRVTSDDR